MSDSNTLTIGSCSSVPGKITSGELKIGGETSSDGEAREIHIPVFMSQGLETGPTVAVMSGISGMDVNGIASVHRLIDEIDPKTLKGRIVFLPILNASGYYAASKAHPYDGKLLENSFPGSASGTVTERIAHELMEKVFSKSDFAVLLRDEEGIATEVYPKVYGSSDIINKNDVVIQKALSTGSDVVLLELPLEGHISTEMEQKYEVPLVTVMTGGRGSEWINKAVDKSIAGIKNLLAASGMLDLPTKLPDEQFIIKDLGGYYASIGGILKSFKSLGDFVNKGEFIAEILNPETGEKVSVSSDISGYLYQLNQSNRIMLGDKVFVIAAIKTEKGKMGQLAKDALKIVENNEVEEPQKA